jgi:hypothetical protein
MAEAEGIPPTASTASVGLGIRYLGQHVYAFSGEIVPAGAAAADTVMLDFTSGSGYIVGLLSWQNDSSGSADEFYNFTINGTTFFNGRYANAVDASNDQPYSLILPPFTHLVIKMGTNGAGKMTVTLTGRVYDV